MANIKTLLDDILSTLEKISINYESNVGHKTRHVVDSIKLLLPLIIDRNPIIYKILSNASSKIITSDNRINAYFFGDIRTSIKILADLYCSRNNKIFISHSSKDKYVIERFVDNILQLGTGIKSNEIFCTSIEDMNIHNGEEIRAHIKNNIKTSDFSFLMISKNYKKSEICLNEMGAVWINDNNIRYFLLPNTNFYRIGWLCNTKQAEQINNPIVLDKIHKELINFYHIENDVNNWSRQRESFLKSIKNKKSIFTL